ncbi:RNA-directed DNA polymerase, eukaryota, reverse transcriptase zinc-binding domain protein [Tanacetum coccineum]
MLRDYLSFVIANWKGEVVMMGDLNEVRKKAERFGSVFNVQGADAFNLFISNTGLEEVPLGGCCFTWCHKSATKMSKLDCFLISESLMSAYPNISAITLDRYLSDHRPIQLRESKYDYGPIPFRFFHCWFEMEGFDKLVKDTWNEALVDESNAMINLMKKLKYLKEKIRVWNNDKKKSSKISKISFKAELAELDAVIDKGEEAAQKAKIKWEIEGDENSKYYHGILNKKRNQLTIRGILVEDMGLLDFIKTADPRKVRVVKVQKGDDQVTLLESTRHCFMPLVVPGAGGSGFVAATKIPALTERGQESVAEEDAYLELEDPGEGTTTSTTPSVAPHQESESFVDLSAQPSLQIRTTVGRYCRSADVNPDLAGPSQLEESEGPDDSFYELATLDPSEAKRWYVPRWNITNDSLLDDGFSCHTLVDRVAPLDFFSALRSMDCDQLYTEFNVGAARQICLGTEVRSRAEHELELKEKLNAKYAAREKEAETAEVVRLCDQVSSLSGEKSALTAEVSALKVACIEAGTKITSLASERDRLASEVFLYAWGFKDFMGNTGNSASQRLAQELYNRVAKLEAHMMDVSGRLEGEFYLTYLTLLAGRRWLQTHGIQLALLKCLKSLEYQGILGHALGRAVDFGMQRGAYYVNAVRALEDAHFPLLSIPIHHVGDKTPVGETSLSFALMNVHARAEGAKKHAAALRQLMMEIVSASLSSQNWVGEASISAAPLSVEDYAEEDTDETLGSGVAASHL